MQVKNSQTSWPTKLCKKAHKTRLIFSSCGWMKYSKKKMGPEHACMLVFKCS